MNQSQLPVKTKERCRCLLIPAFLIIWSSLAYSTQDETTAKVQLNLSEQVKDFENQGKPLIPTLLRIAADYHLPMGIEMMIKEAVEQPISVKLQRRTLSELLDTCISQVPGYSWSLQDGAIHVYGVNELKDSSNLFNLVIPFFEVNDETINRADSNLRSTLFYIKEKPTGGVIGSYLFSLDLEVKRLSFKVQNATVREILNRMVALHGEVVWIARVPPEGLSRLPQRGLWQLLPRSTQNATSFLEQESK